MCNFSWADWGSYWAISEPYSRLHARGIMSDGVTYSGGIPFIVVIPHSIVNLKCMRAMLRKTL